MTLQIEQNDPPAEKKALLMKRSRSFILFIPAIFLIFFSVSILNAGYTEGEKVFAAKCASCHTGYIPMATLKKNFADRNNTLLHLEAPTVNMLTHEMLYGAKKLGDPDDREMRHEAVALYLEEYLSRPSPSESILPGWLRKFFTPMPPVRNLSEKELSDLADFFLDNGTMRLKSEGEDAKRGGEGIDLPRLLADATESGRTLIVEATSSYCHYCTRMEKEVLEDPEVKAMLEKYFILVQVNVDRQKLPPKLEKFYRRITPSFFFLDATGKLLESVPGSWKKNDFMMMLRRYTSKRM